MVNTFPKGISPKVTVYSSTGVRTRLLRDCAAAL